MSLKQGCFNSRIISCDADSCPKAMLTRGSSTEPYSSIWYSRGWTFQEMVFSPRKIMFQYQLAIWECNATSWHESSLLKTSSPLNNIWYKPSINRWNDKVQFSAWPDVKQYVSLVNDYTNRKLTYGEDGINAISSLLSVMGSSFSGGFINGLPEMFFNEALLWQPMEIMQRRSSSAGLNDIPSWSWAGVRIMRSSFSHPQI